MPLSSQCEHHAQYEQQVRRAARMTAASFSHRSADFGAGYPLGLHQRLRARHPVLPSLCHRAQRPGRSRHPNYQAAALWFADGHREQCTMIFTDQWR
jgi:hypothetical protein